MSATVFLIPVNEMINFLTKDVKTALDNFATSGRGYQDIFAVETELKGEKAAEDLFDLSNNPGRDAERAQRWGIRRSLSVGDVVHVDGDSWICCSMGWAKI